MMRGGICSSFETEVGHVEPRSAYLPIRSGQRLAQVSEIEIRLT